MSTWMIFCCIWAISALGVVLFIRGAHPHVERPQDEGDSVRVPVGRMKGEH